MITKPEKIILPESPEAAHKETREVWVDRNGRSFFDERTARWSGTTHLRCECGTVVKKNGSCRICADKREAARYAAMPKKPWDGKTPLCMDGDRWFYSIEDVWDYMEEYDVKIDGMPLIIGEPVYARPIPDDWFANELPEETDIEDIDPDLAKMIDDLNEYIRSKKVILSWREGGFAADMSEFFKKVE